jgi:hypothetical protein
MWEDWVKFQAQAARRRREKKEAFARAAILRKERIENFIEYCTIGTAIVIFAALMIYGFVLYYKYLR